jgi:VWFA-related protein
MRRSLIFALVVLLMPLSGPGQRSQQETELPSFRKTINVVNIFFTVRDNYGAFVPNLSKDEFEVLENGKPQTLKYFSGETNLPMTLGLLIDTSDGMRRMLPTEKLVAADFLPQVITEKDLGFIINFDISVNLRQDLTSDIHLLRAGLDQAKIKVGGGDLSERSQGPVPASNPNVLLYDAVYLASSEILGKQVGRKAMVILTQGNDKGGRLKLRDAIEAAQKADAICYVLLLIDPQFPSDVGDMRQLTEQTGGRVIEVQTPNKIGDAFRQISIELRSQYSLGYSPEDTRRDGTFRKIEIKSKRGHRVRARRGYYAPSS